MSELVSAVKEKDLKECYERVKQLKLKKVSLVEARQNSAKLLKQQQSSEEDSRIGQALDRLCVALLKRDS